jgi:hypothetical protein
VIAYGQAPSRTVVNFAAEKIAFEKLGAVASKGIARNEFDEAATARPHGDKVRESSCAAVAEKRPPRFEARATFSGIAAGLPPVGN